MRRLATSRSWRCRQRAKARAARAHPGSSQRLPGVEFVAQFVGRYDGEIAAADAELGRLFARLRASGLYDRSLIVVTADHGESLGEGDVWFSHGERLDDPQARVPLVVKLPAGAARVRAGTRVAEPVSAVDVAPTILAAVGAPPPTDPFSGTDLVPVARGKRRPGAPPLTERVSRQDLRVMAHERDCAVHWAIPRHPPPDAARWTEAVSAVSIEPPEAGEPCKERLARASFERVRDALALAPRFPVTRRTDVLRPGGKTEFIEAREGEAAQGDRPPEVPIDARDREALKAFGYAGESAAPRERVPITNPARRRSSRCSSNHDRNPSTRSRAPRRPV
ncbi:MAG: sulfatase-like hydrolase/transferase [Deltaproteobacteria bacterium]|nr:sulfatase-like hydrolase/transferase [Deltaproteobacteria bacterium]